MSNPQSVIGMLWLGLILFWLISALQTKPNVARRVTAEQVGVRLLIIVLIIAMVRVRTVRHVLGRVDEQVITSPLAGSVGVLLCVIGAGLAVWARIHIGRNWGMPMSQKQDRELVTSGPYAFVRHPIYTALMLMMIGSAVGARVVWVLPLVLFGAYFVYAARREEQDMLKEFPETYPAYMKRTGMLLPRFTRGGAGAA